MPTLDEESTIWIEQEDLGTERLLTYKNKRYTITIPKKINRHVILRLRGLGKTRKDKTGNLLLHIWLNKGEDIKENLWLSETSARNGVEKKLLFDETQIIMKVPPKSHDGLTIRLKGYGREADFNWRAPFLHRKRGNLLVRLSVYPDTVTPRYGSFDMLSTEDMALEGWVYRKIDEVFQKMGKPSFLIDPIKADEGNEEEEGQRRGDQHGDAPETLENNEIKSDQGNQSIVQDPCPQDRNIMHGIHVGIPVRDPKRRDNGSQESQKKGIVRHWNAKTL